MAFAPFAPKPVHNKKFPIETLSARTDSSIKNLVEVEYGNQICPQHQKTKIRRKIRSEVYLLLPLYINRFKTKKFLIRTLLEMIDSSVRSLGEVEYDNKNWLQHQKTQVWPNNSK
jgi:hypothetical protein